MKKQVMVIGLGKFGISLSNTLSQLNYEILAVDIDESKVQLMAPQVTQAIQGDTTNESVLKDLDVKNFDTAIVAIGSDIKSSVLTTILLKKLEVPYVIARAYDELHGNILSKIGADIVVYPEIDTATRLAHLIRERNVIDYISVAPNYGVFELVPPPYFVNKKLSDLGFSHDCNDNIAVLIIKHGDQIILNPKTSEVVQAFDTLIIAASDDGLERLLSEAEKNYEKEMKLKENQYDKKEEKKKQ